MGEHRGRVDVGKLTAVIKREYLERVRTKWFLVATLFGPILMGGLMIVPAYLSSRGMASADVSNILVLDASGTDLGRRVAGVLGAVSGDTTAAHVRVVAPDQLARAETTATREVMRRAIRGYLVVDRLTLDAATARYAGRNATSLPDVDRIERAVQQSVMSLRLEREGFDPGRVQMLANVKATVRAERITDRGRGGSGQITMFFAFAVAFLLYMLIVLYGQTIMRGVMEEKTTRVAEVVVASVPSDTLLAGKVLGVGAVALTQLALWIATSVLVILARRPITQRLGLQTIEIPLPDVSLGTGLVLVLFFVLGFTFYASLFAAVGSMVNSDQDAQQAATPVTLLIVFSAIFIQPVLLNPNATISAVVSWLPFSAPIIMPVRMSLISLPWYELTGVIAGMLLACAVAVWFASRIYRVGLLMYGKKPTMGELVRWLRYAD